MAILLQELAQFHKRRLLEALRSSCPARRSRISVLKPARGEARHGDGYSPLTKGGSGGGIGPRI